MARKNYTEEFRRQAVDLYRSTPGATLRGIAADSGDLPSTPCRCGCTRWTRTRRRGTPSDAHPAGSSPAGPASRARPGSPRGRAGRVAGAGSGAGDRERRAAGHRAGHPAPGGQVFRRGDELVSRFQFVADHRHAFEVKRLCEIVQVARSSFYAWLAAAPAGRAGERGRGAGRADPRDPRAGQHQGVPRITAELNDGAPPAARVNHKRVARVMRAHGSPGCGCAAGSAPPSPSRPTRSVPDLLRRDFTAAAPNQRYVGDITYLPLADGSNLYLATVIDCFSRRLAGWAIAEHMRTDLVADALTAARDTRGSLAGAIFHSDHGAAVHARRPSPQLCASARGDAVDGRGRHQRRQRAGRVVQRLAQARDAAGRARLARRADVSAGGVPVGDPLQHPPPPLLLRPTGPDRLRTATRIVPSNGS